MSQRRDPRQDAGRYRATGRDGERGRDFGLKRHFDCIGLGIIF